MNNLELLDEEKKKMEARKHIDAFIIFLNDENNELEPYMGGSAESAINYLYNALEIFLRENFN